MKPQALRIEPRAQAHLSEAYDWYEQQKAGLGQEFLDAIEASLERIAEGPGAYPIVRHDIRRAVTRRFPYLIFYVVEDDAVAIIAVLHASRDPRRWP